MACVTEDNAWAMKFVGGILTVATFVFGFIASNVDTSGNTSEDKADAKHVRNAFLITTGVTAAIGVLLCTAGIAMSARLRAARRSAQDGGRLLENGPRAG